MIDRLAFASCYVYSPAGESAICARSRLLCALLKECDARFMVRYAVRVREQTQPPSVLAGFFLSGDLLVPVPRSAPTVGGAWAAAGLAQALVREGIGAEMWSGLHRISPVRKSATAPKGSRPSVARHYESFRLVPPTVRPASVMIIDDVISRGRTLLAAAARVREAFPKAQIRAFALLRTQSFVASVPNLLEPCRGEIRWMDGEARRYP
jgi:hypothetical protein